MKGLKCNVSQLPRPHGGGDLQPLSLTGPALEEERRRASTLPRLAVSSREHGDLVMLGIGGFTPLQGFMSYADWQVGHSTERESAWKDASSSSQWPPWNSPRTEISMPRQPRSDVVPVRMCVGCAGPK